MFCIEMGVKTRRGKEDENKWRKRKRRNCKKEEKNRRQRVEGKGGIRRGGERRYECEGKEVHER